MKRLLHIMFVLLVMSLTAIAQDRTVTGKVTAKRDGSPLRGVSVTVKATRNSTQTDANGKYSIKVTTGSQLVFSFLGFSSQTITVTGETIDVSLYEDATDVSLYEDAIKLEEIVVTGLATSIKRSNLANAVSTISGKELTGQTTPMTLDAAMSGKLVGANIVANGGSPGGGFSVKLRGISSINGSSEPLYIIDGVFVNNSQFNTGAGTRAFSGASPTANITTQDQASNRIADINPADIANIEVLKGPSAAAIYGTRANAGVIIITTKKGQDGKSSISFSQDLGFAEALNLLGIHKTVWNEQFTVKTKLEAAQTQALYAANGGANAKIYDYEKEVYGNRGFLRNTRLSLSGGTDKLKFYAAGALSDEDGIQKRTGYQRNSIRLNIDYKPFSFVDLSFGSNYVNSSASRGFSGNNNNGVAVGYSLAYLPNWLEQHPDANGVYPPNPITGQNILQIIDKAENNERNNRFIQSFSSTFHLLRKDNHALKFALQGGVDYLLSENEVYMPDDLQYQAALANPGASRYTNNRNLNTNLQGFFVYTGNFNQFNLTTQVGATRLTTNRKLDWIQGEGLKPQQRNPNTGAVRIFDERFERWQDVGIVAQQEINWADRIIATGGVRFDKSSLNGDNEKYYPFPKASLAVNISNFDFWKVKPVSLFKLRAAYGETGGVPQFGDLYTPLTDVIIGGASGSGAPLLHGNPTIEPETASELEFGADLGFFNNRLNIEATYYNKEIFNFINPYILSPGTGATQVIAFPVGDFENKGIELGLSGVPLKFKNVIWNSTLNWWRNRSKVTRLTVPEFGVPNSGFGNYGTNRIRLGQSPSAWYGTPLLPPDGSRTVYGDAQPKWQLSFSNNVTLFKNFEFSFLLHHSHKGYNASLVKELTDEGGTTPGWTVANRAALQGPTSQYIVDATFTKLREVSLYYTLPKSVLGNKIANAIESVKVGISGNNLYMWTNNYYGYDPEVSNFGNRPVGGGVDVMSFPSSRRYFFHLNVNF